jgi:hypothetical protein
MGYRTAPSFQVDRQMCRSAEADTLRNLTETAVRYLVIEYHHQEMRERLGISMPIPGTTETLGTNTLETSETIVTAAIRATSEHQRHRAKTGPT